jgi:hypothetical protein
MHGATLKTKEPHMLHCVVKKTWFIKKESSRLSACIFGRRVEGLSNQTLKSTGMNFQWFDASTDIRYT